MKMVANNLNILEGLAGTTQKQYYLQKFACEGLKEVAQYALDPFKTYGITTKALTYGNAAGTRTDWAGLKGLLDRLASRKLSGHVTKAAVENLLKEYDPDVQRVFLKILDRTLDCGVHTTTINKVWPGLIPTFEVQLAKSYTDKKAKWPMLVETKHDGKRIIAIALAGEPVRMYSRNGHEQLGYEHIKTQLAAIREREGLADVLDSAALVFDGELMFGMFGDRKATEAEADFVLFDLLYWSEWTSQKCTRPQEARTCLIVDLWDRQEMGKDWTNIRTPGAEYCYSFEQAQVVYRDVVDNGGEGIMLKDPQAVYQFKRTYSWLKLKPEESLDLEVVSGFEGEGKYRGMLGGVVVNFNGVEVRVGSGFADYQRKMWYGDGFHNLKGHIIEVLYTEVTPDGSLRFPRFKTIRDDKNVPDGRVMS